MELVGTKTLSHFRCLVSNFKMAFYIPPTYWISALKLDDKRFAMLQKVNKAAQELKKFWSECDCIFETSANSVDMYVVLDGQVTPIPSLDSYRISWYNMLYKEPEKKKCHWIYLNPIDLDWLEFKVTDDNLSYLHYVIQTLSKKMAEWYSYNQLIELLIDFVIAVTNFYNYEVRVRIAES